MNEQADPMDIVTDRVIVWLGGIATRPIANVTADTDLLDAGVLDSIEILNLISYIEEVFNIAVPVDEFVPDNFRTPGAIAALVGRLREPAA